ncbi:hypothetical protein [Xanthomonas campestris]|uniref:hypothetical protein n=1 Tax=Xanthomonas campestris TaxID=339 RepID=UPI000E1F0F08|nr:hypothetical protein [Xanthomonas campestris]
MDSTAVWSFLHDGSLDRTDGIVPGDITLRVSIPYLRKAFQPPGDGFILELIGCTQFQLTGDDGAVLSDLGQIADCSLEILSIVSESPLTIYTTYGTLALAYDTLHLALDTGQALTVAQLDQASAEYWQAWSERHGGSA